MGFIKKNWLDLTDLIYLKKELMKTVKASKIRDRVKRKINMEGRGLGQTDKTKDK